MRIESGEKVVHERVEAGWIGASLAPCGASLAPRSTSLAPYGASLALFASLAPCRKKVGKWKKLENVRR